MNQADLIFSQIRQTLPFSQIIPTTTRIKHSLDFLNLAIQVTMLVVAAEKESTHLLLRVGGSGWNVDILSTITHVSITGVSQPCVPDACAALRQRMLVSLIEKEHIVKFLLPEMLEKLSHFIKFLIKKSGMLVLHWWKTVHLQLNNFEEKNSISYSQ
jgi:hypothetical protein